MYPKSNLAQKHTLTDTYSLGSSPVPQSPRDTTKNRLFEVRATAPLMKSPGDATIDTQEKHLEELYLRIRSEPQCCNTI